MERFRDSRSRRGGDRRRRRGAARRDRGVRPRRHGRAGLQVAARQGAHGDGRGRDRRGARPRRPAGRLGDALPRHDEGRLVPQSLAHGADPRPGGAGPRARARALGRAVRPHRRRANLAARLRRAHLEAARARRRPHRPRDDPHAPRPRRPPGRRRLHGVHDHAAVQGRRPHRRRVRLLARRAGASSCSAASPS